MYKLFSCVMLFALSSQMLSTKVCFYEHKFENHHLIVQAAMTICTLLPRNQSFYRQITSQEKDGAVSGVGQW